MGATTSVLAPKQQQANKSKASKTKRLKKCKKSSGSIRAEVGGQRCSCRKCSNVTS